jgi:hypothetical protein
MSCILVFGSFPDLQRAQDFALAVKQRFGLATDVRTDPDYAGEVWIASSEGNGIRDDWPELIAAYGKDSKGEDCFMTDAQRWGEQRARGWVLDGAVRSNGQGFRRCLYRQLTMSNKPGFGRAFTL